MQKLLTIILGLSLTGLVWADTNSNDDVMDKIQELESRINSLQRHISETGVSREEVSAMVRQEIDKTVDTAAWAQSKDVTPAISLSKQIEKFSIKGDLRLRYERQERTTGAAASEQTRDRFRTRLRIGGTWVTDEGWEVAIGLATGDSGGSSSGSSGATSTNDTWSQESPFETGNIYLDYAYAKHTWESEGSEFTLTLGQHKNPYVSSGIFWDGDVRPVGVTAKFEAGGVFLTAGGYEVLWGGRDQASAQLAAAQLGWKGSVADDTKVTLATSYYYYNATTTDVTGPSALPGTLDPDYMFQVGDLYAKVDTKAGDVKVGLWAHTWRNFGAESDFAVTGSTGQLGTTITTKDADGMDTGYALGAKIGISKYSFGYTYAHVEADSVPGFLKDSDFGDTAGMNDTDVKGHKLSGKVNLTKNFSLGLTYMDLESIDDDDPRDGELFQLDAVYKF